MICEGCAHALIRQWSFEGTAHVAGGTVSRVRCLLSGDDVRDPGTLSSCSKREATCFCERCELDRWRVLLEQVELHARGEISAEDVAQFLASARDGRHPFGIAERLSEAISALHVGDLEVAREIVNLLTPDEREAIERGDAAPRIAREIDEGRCPCLGCRHALVREWEFEATDHVAGGTVRRVRCLVAGERVWEPGGLASCSRGRPGRVRREA